MLEYLKVLLHSKHCITLTASISQYGTEAVKVERIVIL